MINVLLADDHTLVRQGVRALLEREPDLSVVAEAGDGERAVELANQHQPDVVVMDLAMPGLNGVDATRRLRETCPQVRVLALSMYASAEYVGPAVRAGVAGYLLKGSGIGELVSAVRAVAAGETFFQDALGPIDAVSGDALSPLSAREREVLQRVAEGWSSAQIGEHLHISRRTVEGHRARITQKLGIWDVAGLVRYAIRNGISPLEPGR